MCLAPPLSSMIPIRARLPDSMSPTFVNPSPMLSRSEFCSRTSFPMSIVRPLSLATWSDSSDMRSLFCCSIMFAFASCDDIPLFPLRGPPRPVSRLLYMSSFGLPFARCRISIRPSAQSFSPIYQSARGQSVDVTELQATARRFTSLLGNGNGCRRAEKVAAPYLAVSGGPCGVGAVVGGPWWALWMAQVIEIRGGLEQNAARASSGANPAA
mmetsp:Transcript_11003/g.25598  ORF Transcript_11003/g.25598 Transcript_11003/m.25598 type:complete len:212 (+) Transcript_11003:137-772(+)